MVLKKVVPVVPTVGPVIQSINVNMTKTEAGNS